MLLCACGGLGVAFVCALAPPISSGDLNVHSAIVPGSVHYNLCLFIQRYTPNKLFGVGTASKSLDFSSKFCGFWSIGDPRQETIVQKFIWNICWSALAV